MARPDPGRAIQLRVLAAMGADERARIGLDLRRRALLAIWQQVDERGLSDPVTQARFILRRRYPEMPESWLEDVVCQLAVEHAAGRWHGFARP